MRYITISETLRPWSLLGITHFLPKDLAYEEQSSADTFSESSSTVSTLDEDVSASYKNQSSVTHNSKLKAPIDSLLPASENQSKNNSSINQSDNYPTDNYNINSFSINNFTLPSEWKVQIDKTPKAPVVWSYSELGLDLAGKGLPQRSACLRSIISRLALPKGSSAFWPFSLLNGKGVLQNNFNAYLHGIDHLSPKVIVLFEDKALQPLLQFFQLNLPFTQQICKGKLYILLPDFPSLLENLSLLENACSYLKSVLAVIPRN